MKPLIFISSVSRELRTARQLVANTLHALGYEPVWQDIFETSPDDLREMLRKKIDSCSAVLQIVGHAYGAEPTTPDETFGRCSYTQYEALYARSRKKPVYYLIAEDDLPRDAAAETIDTPVERTSSSVPPASSVPPGPGGPGHETESEAAQADAAERQRLQSVYRQNVLTAEQVWYPIHTPQETELSVRRLRDDLSKLRRGFQYWMLGITAALVLIAGGIGWMNRGQQKIQQVIVETADTQTKFIEAELAKIKPEQIKDQLRKTIEATYQREVQEADKLTEWQKRDEAKRDAAAARDKRLGQVDEFLATITSTIQSGDASPEFLELTRIVQEQGVDQALAYITSQESRLLKRAEKLAAEKQREIRRELTPLLEGVRLHRSKGELAEARALCDKLLKQDANWLDVLHSHCGTMLELGDRATKYEKVEVSLSHFEAAEVSAKRLVHADAQNPIWQRDLLVSFDRLGDVFLKLGRIDDAHRYYQETSGISLMLAESDNNGSETRRDLSISFIKIGDVLLKLGRTTDALKQYQDALQISREVADADPNDAPKQRDVSSLFRRLGDVYLTLGRTDDALTQYQDALQISRVLAEADPDDTENQRSLSNSLQELGNVYLQFSRFDDALTQFEAQLKINRMLVEADPKQTVKQRAMCASFIKLGDVYLKLGRSVDALTHFQDALQISQLLAMADPNDTQKQSDLSISLERLGRAYLALGRTDDALTQYEANLKITRLIVEADPNDAEKQRNLSVTYQRLGDVHIALGRTDDARSLYETMFVNCRKLAEADPNNAEKQRDLAGSHHRLGEVEVLAGRYESAKGHFKAGIEVLDRMIENGQNVSTTKKEKDGLTGRLRFCEDALLAISDWETLLKADAKLLPVLLSIRATELANRGQLTEVAQSGAKLRELSATAEKGSDIAHQAGILYNAACAYSLCGMLVTKDKTQTTEAEQAERKKYLDLSLACVKEALAAGYDNFEHMRKDTDLQPLHGLPEFEALFPKKPE